jgi:hypothetical protein
MIETFSDLIPYYSWLYIPIALIVFFSIGWYCRSCCSRTEKKISILFGILFVWFYISGLVVSSGASLNLKSVSFIFVSSILFSPIIGIGYHHINLFLRKQLADNNDKYDFALARHTLLFPFIIIMVCWIPVFLALYPGLFAYDVRGQIPQEMGRYSTHHPLLHTFFLKAFYWLGKEIGSYNTGMAISTFLQMALFALALAYAIQYMINKRIKKSIIIAVLLFFSVIPIFSIMAVSMTKDILFAAAFVASFVKVLELNETGLKKLKIKDWMLILGLLTLTSLLRSNGKYAVYALLAVMFLKSVFNRVEIKQNYFLAVTTALLITVSNTALIAVTKARTVSKNEMMSVPYQQLARTYKYDIGSFSSNDLAILKTLIPKIMYYNEHKSDSIKGSATVFNSYINQKLFWEIYIRYMLKKPDRYLEAFLINTIGYWYLDDISSSQMYGKRADGGINDDFGLFLMDTKGGFGVTHESKFQLLDSAIKKLFHENKYQNIPVVAVIFNMGTYFWFFVMFLFYCIQTKNSQIFIPCVFILAYMATVFAGPCALFRYALPYIICLPPFMVAVYKNK